MDNNNQNQPPETIESKTTLIQHRQNKLGFIIITAVLVIILSLYWLLKGDKKDDETLKEQNEKTKVAHPVNLGALAINWQDGVNQQVEDGIKETLVIKTDVATLKEINLTQQEILRSQASDIAALKQQLLLLEKKPGEAHPGAPGFDADADADQNPTEIKVRPQLLQIDNIQLVSSENSPLPKTIHNYVPAGSFVETIMLGGLDAHAGVNAQSDPHPVLLRVLDNGVLPNNRNSQLESCRLIGAGYGDISSERAYIRLERMSCEQHGFFTDYPVYGYVTGPDGKDGIRGRVVIRDRDVVTRAFLGGFLGGLSDAASQGFTTQSISPLGSVETVKGADVLAYSGSEGAGNAMELYARYNIKRAELYQPVIEIPAGTKVNVVFNRGFYLDGLGMSDPAKLAAPQMHENFLIEQQKEAQNDAEDFLTK